jgi:hypothetical protein
VVWVVLSDDRGLFALADSPIIVIAFHGDRLDNGPQSFSAIAGTI